MSKEQNTGIEKQGRIEKVSALKELGINPYPNQCNVTHSSVEILNDFDKLEKDKTIVTIAGRVMLFRVMGKSSFITIKDSMGSIQIYVQKDKVGEEFYNTVFKKLIDVGDIIEASGVLFKTQTGEVSIHVDALKLLTKTLNPLPEKFHGLTDTELRYRQRYVDLIMNDDVKALFIKRSEERRVGKEC